MWTQPWLIPSLVWGLLAAGVIGLHLYFPPIAAPRTATSYSPSADGFKALYLVLAKEGAVYRSETPVSRLMETTNPEETVLLILSPPRPPSEEEWRSLKSWVGMGGHLLYASPPGESDPLGTFDAEITTDSGPADDRVPPKSYVPANGKFLWWPEGEVVGAPEDAVLVAQDGSPQAVRLSVGRGEAVFVAGPWIFSNQLLSYGDNSALAYELVRAAIGEGRTPEEVVIAFDESLNTLATPQMMGVLFQPPLRAISVQILLLFMLYGWWNSCRFGPILPLEQFSRREIVEHTNALGLILWRSPASPEVLSRYLRYWLAEFRLQEPALRRRRLASRLGAKSDAVDEALAVISLAEQAAQSKSLRRRETARQIQALAQLGTTLRR